MNRRLDTMASVWIFSLLSFIHFLCCPQGEFVLNGYRASLVGDHWDNTVGNN